MKRILVVGCPGAGKTTAAKKLSLITGLPVIHLDQHFWKPGWQNTDTETWATIQKELIDGEQWIIDGNCGSSLPLRIAAADAIVHLDFSTWVCFRRAIYRSVVNLGRARSDVGPGCPERFEVGFFRFILNYRKERRQRDILAISRFSGRLFRLESPRQLEEFLQVLSVEKPKRI
jgi:adenylate kinase family enzyme